MLQKSSQLLFVLGLLLVSLLSCEGNTPVVLETAVPVAPAPTEDTVLPSTPAESAEISPAAAEPISAAAITSDSCLNTTRDEPECKDCCDSLGADGAVRKACRDACPSHDFAQNTDFITLDVPSNLGPAGDYSVCTTAGDERACKDCCDDSVELEAGDRRFCRDACAATDAASSGGGNPPPERPPAGDPPPQGTENPPQDQSGPREMNIEQAISDEAQRNTIAFDALAFLTGNLGADSFFPPGKVADF